MFQIKRQGSPADAERSAKRVHLIADTPVDDESLTEPKRSVKSCTSNSFSNEPTCSDGDEIICYGSLCESEARFLPRAQTRIRKSLPRNIEYHLGSIELYKRELSIHLHELGPVALLDLVTAKIIQQISEQPLVQTTAIISADYLGKKRPFESQTTSFPFSINIIGPKSSAEMIGELLARNDAFLQHPRWLQNGIRYINPQYYPSDLDLTDYVGMSEKELKGLLLSDEVENVLASLDGDGVEEDVDLIDLKSELKPHQRVALGFIRQRESVEVCEKRHAELRLMMNLPAVDKMMHINTGGILADVMGLGKTLTMLCTIRRTRDQAEDYRLSQISLGRHETALHVTQATLVVVTSIQVLEVWTKDLQTHFRDGALDIVVFHGQRRTSNPMDLTKQHLVLTTYGTLVADAKGSRTLQKMAWYRVILDEAHVISNKTSLSSIAAAGLVAEKRWCVTGTPIQNQLEDLTSLLRFLHVRSFGDPAIFGKHILEPLRSDSIDKSRNLRALLQTICLRRNETYLGLSEPTYVIKSINFSAHERIMYTAAQDHGRREMDEVVSGNSQRKRHTIQFSTIMKLRRLCNHGTFTLGAEPKCDSCDVADEDRLALLSGCAICPDCSRSLGDTAVSTPRKKTSKIVLTPSPHRDAQMMDVDMTAGLSQVQSDSIFESEAPSSSKLEAVVEDLTHSNHDSKSLVFSFWTSTLDLLQSMLEEYRLSYLKIDGRVSHDERRRILEKFSQHEGPAILLMSIKTGAVGLNITAANRIHIIEPQWNPSVEHQAIARVLRMGQRRPVTIIRYIVKNTVEEAIVASQKRKTKLAKITLDSDPSDKSILSAIKDFEFVLKRTM